MSESPRARARSSGGPGAGGGGIFGGLGSCYRCSALPRPAPRRSRPPTPPRPPPQKGSNCSLLPDQSTNLEARAGDRGGVAGARGLPHLPSNIFCSRLGRDPGGGVDTVESLSVGHDRSPRRSLSLPRQWRGTLSGCGRSESSYSDGDSTASVSDPRPPRNLEELLQPTPRHFISFHFISTPWNTQPERAPSRVHTAAGCSRRRGRAPRCSLGFGGARGRRGLRARQASPARSMPGG